MCDLMDCGLTNAISRMAHTLSTLIRGVVFKRNNDHVPRCDTSIDRPYDETFNKIVGPLYAVPRPPK